ncbi:MAG: PAS domain S-box protein [Ignavibacteriales bacterium]
MKKPQILIVEDEQLVAYTIQRTLTKSGFQIAGIAASGIEALRIAAEKQPDLILMDIDIKGKRDGIDTASEIQKTSDVPIIYLTAFTDEEIINRVKDTHPYGFLIKPLDERELFTSISLALNKYSFEKEIKNKEKCFNAERKQYIDQLRRNETLLTQIATATPIGLYVVDYRTDEILYVNERFCEIWNITHLKYEIKSRKIKHSDLMPLRYSMVKNKKSYIDTSVPLHDEGNDSVLEDDFELNDGRTIHRYSTQVRDEYGKYYGRLYTFEDITHHKIYEMELSESKEQYRELVENQGEGVGFVDANERFLFANPAAETIFGVPGELVGRNLTEFLSPDQLEIVKEQTSRREKGEDNVYELQITRPGGEIVDILVTVRAKFDKKGVFIGSFGIFRDISERKRSEEKLRQSEEKYRFVVENLKEVIFQTDKDGKWSFLNPAWTEVTGFSIKETLENNFLEYVHPDDRARNAELFKPLIERKKEYCRHQIRYLTKDGGFKWVEVYARLILDKEQHVTGTAGTLFDISERKLAEEEMQKALEKERELSQLRSRFISIVSHEYRTPLTSISASSELLERYHKKWPDEKKVELLQRIQKSVDYMVSMLNDVLMINKADSGKLEFNPVSMDLVKASSIMAEETRLQSPDTNKIIFQSIESEIRGYFDEKLLRQIISNLLSNAVKYSNSNKNIYFSISMLSGCAVITIKDEGIGISERDQIRLFEPFFRGNNALSLSGTGLGLSIVKRAVDLHKGTIQCSSRIGEGTTFTIQLPVSPMNSIPLEL